jgi:ABC-type amino acid transport substrate-binding protein
VKILALFLGLLVSLCISSANASESNAVFNRVIETNTIRCGYFVFPPYFLKDANTGALSGINYDFMMEIGKILDLKIDWAEETTPGTAITGLETNRYDVMCASVWPDAARLKHAQITTPEFYSSVYAIARADDTRFDGGKASFNDPSVTFAAIDGDTTFSIPTELFPKAKIFSLPQSADGAQLFQSVVTKKADLTLMDPGSMADFNRNNPDKLLKVVVGIPPVRIYPETLAVKSGEIQLLLLLENALRIMRDRGIAADFVARYPNYGYYPTIAGFSASR